MNKTELLNKLARDNGERLLLARGQAADLIASGRVQLNHRECVKPDHAVAQGDVLSCRGLGKCVLTEVGGPSKKGRILIVLERYV